MKFQFSIQRDEKMNAQMDFELFYLIEGKCTFTVEDESYKLGKDDFLIVNTDKQHGYTSEGELLSASIYIPYSELMRLLRQELILFNCNSAQDGGNELYDEVRLTLKQILNEEGHEHGPDEIYLLSLYYRMLNMLTHNFLISSADTHVMGENEKYSERCMQIHEYVRQNFNKPMRLHELAQKLFLSDSYLSKNIKKILGMSFLDYVSTVRLNYIVSELLYTDQPIVRIAMDSGFASPATMNKAFREKYGMTPSCYRAKLKKSRVEKQLAPEEETQVESQVRKYFRNLSDAPSETEGRSVRQETFEAGHKAGVLDRNWNRMINAGTAGDLLSATMQRHILRLKKELLFTYIRFWDIYSGVMMLDIHRKYGTYNFGRLDNVLDFLVDNGMRPFMELGTKNKVLIGSRGKSPLEEQERAAFSSWEEMQQFHTALIDHLVRRYTAQEVGKWYFELWEPEPPVKLKDGRYEAISREEAEKRTEDYLHYFTLIASIYRERLPEVRIGGCGISNRFGDELPMALFRKWAVAKEQPDFLSVYGYPYGSESSRRDRNQSIDQDYLKNFVLSARKMMKEAGFNPPKLFVTEWNFSISNRNVLNDSCMKGAYIVRNLITALSLENMIGYWVGSDLFAEYSDVHGALFGGNGLLTRDGIEKPSYYAFRFLNEMGKFVRSSDENCLITDNGSEDYRIVCHNGKALSFQYSLKDEGNIDIAEQDSLMADVKKLHLHFVLPARQGRTYEILSRFVNASQGSVKDEWLTLQLPDDMSRDDTDYLRRIAVPGYSRRKITADEDSISFDFELQPNEIRLIEVTPEV
ncbi:MAG: helix-turn-helix domain-containing protein [Lachnospiraceae bacterium]|jgi:beta-xylosidase/AraC-like DNA-binding protein|nr:helix-turn-helix domain-containing protein [Lachnospiraceae bacterium]